MMKRRVSDLHCLMIVEDWPLSRASPGGAGPLNLSHLELLADSMAEIDLLVLSDPRGFKGWEDFIDGQGQSWQRVQNLCSSWRHIEMRPRQGVSAPLRNAWRGLQDPSRLLIDVEAETALKIQQHVHQSRPDLIWAEHLVPATLVDRFLSEIPWIYSHHDWNWRIKKHRTKKPGPDLKRQVRTGLRRRFEENLVRRAAACVSGSSTEAASLRRLGVREVGYFPASFEPALLGKKVPQPHHQARIVHLGGLKTTATRLGLERFLERVWPKLMHQCNEPPEFWVIGSLDGASSDLRQRLETVGAICPGFVADLRPVLRPGDLHILPWEHDTGTRTRVPLVLSFAQVLVAVQAGVACLDELQHGKNCVLVEELDDMAEALATLLKNRDQRRRLSRAGLSTLRRHWTRRAQRPNMGKFLKLVLG